MGEPGRPEIQGKWRRGVIRLLHVYFRFARGMTLGVRAACFDENGHIFLVRHTYVPGWYMPGGGVEIEETATEAIAKELREEGNLELLEEPELLHVYLNMTASRRDHVLFYRARVRQTALRMPDQEIADSGFFSLDALPDGVTRAILDRLAELKGEKPRSDFW